MAECSYLIPAPFPPSGVTVSQNELDSVQVSWTPPAGGPAVTGYIIYYQQQDGGHSDSEIAATTATTAIITGLIAGATYSITMVATSRTLPSTVTAAETITTGMKSHNYTGQMLSLVGRRSEPTYLVIFK